MSLSQLILVVVVTAFFFRVRVLESQVARDEFRSLMSLKALAQSAIHYNFTLTKEAEKFTIEAHRLLQPDVIEVMKAEHAEMNDQRVRSREKVVEWLIAQGVPKGTLGDASGKGHSDNLPFLFFASTLAQRDAVKVSSTPLSVSDYGDVQINQPSVRHLLTEATYWSQTSAIRVVTSIKTEQLPSVKFRISSGRNQFTGRELTPFYDPAEPIPAGREPFEIDQDPVVAGSPHVSTERDSSREYQLESVRLSDTDSLIVTFIENARPGIQQLPRRERIEIPVVTSNISCRWSKLTGNHLSDVCLDELSTDSEQSHRLAFKYGAIPYEQAIKVSTDRMLETYGNVKLLGFDFVPDKFWMFLAIFLLVFHAAIAFQLKHPDSDDKEETSMLGLHKMLDSTLFRAGIWAVAPAVSLLLVIPDSAAGTPVKTGHWISVLIICVTGAVVTRIPTRAIKNCVATSK